MDKDWYSNYMKNITGNIRVITAMQESLRPSSAVMDSIKGITAMQESLRPSSAVMDSIKGITAMQESFRPSSAVMESIKGITAMQESFRPSSAVMESIKGITAMQESLRPSSAVMESIKGITAMQESFRPSLGVMDNFRGLGSITESLRPSSGVLESMRIVLAGRSEIAKAALEISNINETVNLVLRELSAENLNLNERFNILSNFKMPLESSNPSHVDEEIKIEDNEFTRYWLAMYEHFIRVYSVLNSSLAAMALRDLIMVLSFINSMQGGQAPQINFYNETDSNVEVNINGNQMDVIITHPEESNTEKEGKDDVDEEIEIILNPGIRS